VKANVAVEAMTADLEHDEAILAEIWASHEVTKSQTTLGAIAVTNRRIRYVGSIANLLVDRSFPLETVTAIEIGGTKLLAKLHIYADAENGTFGVRSGERLRAWVEQAKVAREQLVHQQHRWNGTAGSDHTQ